MQTDEYLDFLAEVHSGKYEYEQIQILDHSYQTPMKLYWLIMLILALLPFGQVFGRSDIYHVEDFHQNDTTGNLEIWPGMEPENAVKISWQWTQTDNCKGYRWAIVKNDSEFGQEILTVLQTGQPSDKLDESVIVNGENINDFLARWHNYTKTDHPFACNVYLPIVVN